MWAREYTFHNTNPNTNTNTNANANRNTGPRLATNLAFDWKVVLASNGVRGSVPTFARLTGQPVNQ